MKYVFLIIFILFSLHICSDLFYVFTYDINYFFNNAFIIQSDTLKIPENKLQNSLFIFVFNSSLESRVFNGPSFWNHKTKTLYFIPDTNFFVNTEYTFNDYYHNFDRTFSQKSLLFMTLSNIGNNKLYYLMYINRNNIDIDNLNIFSDISIYNEIKYIMKYYYYLNKKDYQQALNNIYYLHNLYEEDKNIFQLYVYALMDVGAFIEAKNEIKIFFNNKEKNDFYYSLMVNLYAISANFKMAEKTLLTGRNLFPESKILLEDGIKLYSILDTIKMNEYIDILNNIRE